MVGPRGATGLTGLIGATGQQGISGTAAAGGQRWGYTGNGIQNVFQISGATSLISSGYLVVIDGVVQDPNDYSITSGIPYNITISSPVPLNSKLVIVEIVGPIGATGPQGATGILPTSNAGNVWTFTGDGTATTWTLTGNTSGSLVSANYLVAADGVLQAPANYTINNVSPRTLTISTVPSGSALVVVSLSTA
jgi:hypothetical protein